MSLKSTQLKYNIAYNVAYQILSIIVPIFTAPFVFRVLGKEGVGLYGYSFSIAHYFSLFCMLGILNYGVREISMVSPDKKKMEIKFKQIYSIQLFAGIISLIAYLLIVNYCIHSDKEVFFIQGLFIIASLIDVSWFLFGTEHFKITTIISTINKLLTTVCIFLLIRRPTDVYIYALILSIGTILNNLFYWIAIRRIICISPIEIKGSYQHLKPIIILFIPVIAINIYKYIDKIMLGSMLNFSEVGIFEAAEKLQNVPMCLIAAFGTVMLPRISNMMACKQSDNVKHYNMLSFVIVMCLTMGMAFGLAGISGPFIPIFYGDGYEESISVLMWLLPSMAFVGWANIIRTQFLLPRRMDGMFCLSVILGAVVNVIANIFFIPRYGAHGAAISTTIAEFTVCLIQSYTAFHDMHLFRPFKNSIPFVVVGLLMYVLMINFNTNSELLTIIVRILIGSIVYVALSVIIVMRFSTKVVGKT